MGLITEAFRRRSGVLRSLNPVHPVLALGPEAAKLVADHERQLHSCGKGSPFAKLYDLKAKILFLDAPFSPAPSFTFWRTWSRPNFRSRCTSTNSLEALPFMHEALNWDSRHCA